MEYSKLRGRIIEKFGTITKFADEMQIDKASVSGKLNKKTEWKRNEIEKACILLGIDIENVHLYFFV